MICSNCKYCRGFGMSNGQFNVVCVKLGENCIAECYGDAFECEMFEEREYVEPPKNNIFVACIHGYSKKCYVPLITSINDLPRYLNGDYKFITLGNDIFNIAEIASISYIGD